MKFKPYWKGFKKKTNQITAALGDLSEGDKSFDETYQRVANHLDKKYEHPVLALYYSAVGDAGADNPENSLALSRSEDIHARYLAESFQKEYPEQANPFTSVRELFAEGVWPRDFRIIEGREVFVVDVPLLVTSSAGNKHILSGCWSDGETELRYLHSLNDDCQYNFDTSMSLKESSPRQVESLHSSFYVSEPPIIEF